MFRRPRNNIELEDLEAIGLWKAIAVAKEIGESDEKITLEKILHLHGVLLKSANPEGAGRFRKNGEDVKRLKCVEPPPGRIVEEKMYEFWKELDIRLAVIPRHPRKYTKTQRRKWYKEVFEVAAFVQYKIAQIHPFCEGNGRTARLMTNVILSRFGLPPSTVNYEGENRTKYLETLCQIDKYLDYEPLIKLVAKSVSEAFKKEEKLRKK